MAKRARPDRRRKPTRRNRNRRRKPWWTREWAKLIARVGGLAAVNVIVLQMTATHFDSSEGRALIGITAGQLIREIFGVKPR